MKEHMTDEAQELLDLTHRLLDAIHKADLETYRALSAPDLTCYETDVAPYRIDGVDFHIDLMAAMKGQKTYASLVRFDMLTPHVQIYGDSAVVTYTRLMTYTGDGAPFWRAFNETRVYARLEGAWKMVHFHRSQASI
jgi:ketosteroid isomerase-like protein